MPAHYGIKCTKGHAPLGSIVLLMFYVVWTVFVTYIIRNDPLIQESLRRKSSNVGKEVKDLLISTY